MKDVNKVILVGRLGANPELKETKNGISMTHFPLATERRFRVKVSESEEGISSEHRFVGETQWHRVVVWGKQAEHCSRYLKKGSSVYIEGNLRSRQFEGRDGQFRQLMEVHAEEVCFLGGKPKPELLPEQEEVAENLPEAIAS